MTVEHMKYALQHLTQYGCSCTAYNGKDLLESKSRGVAPLLQWLDGGQDLSGYAVADKVVGKGAAFLYLLLKTRQLHAVVISRPALELLEHHGVQVTFDSCVPAIRNREDTGFCPIESAVLACTEPTDALMKIKKKLEVLRK